METSLKLTRRNLVSDGMLGRIFFLSVEVMLFAGFISALMVNRSATEWPPFGQPRLPVEITFINTLILLASAVTLWLFRRKFSNSGKKTLLITSIILGTIFLLVQGSEWAKLIGFGLTTSSSLYGAFFYMIIGAHAAHAIAGLLILHYLYRALLKGYSKEVMADKISYCSLYWYFVVGIWPVLYLMVYIL